MEAMKHNYPLILSVFIILAIIGFSFDTKLMEEKPRTEEPKAVEPKTVNLPNIEQDFNAEQQGTVTFETNLNVDAMLVDGVKADYIVFFESKNIEGLKIRYNVNDKTFEAGLPAMKSSPIEFGNGKVHSIRYAFAKGIRQELVFDNNLIAAGYYDGVSKRNTLTGFAVFGGNEIEVGVDNIEVR